MKKDVDKEKLDELLALLVEDARNRSTNPVDEINTSLALFDEEEVGASDENNGDAPSSPKQRGASARNVNNATYLKMLTTLDTKLRDQLQYSPRSSSSRSGPMNELNLSPMRLLAEHRRKLLLKSLCGFEDVPEDRDKATKSVEKSFNFKVNIPIYGFPLVDVRN